MIKTAKQLVAACLQAVNNYKTLYVMGCFGAPMTQKNKARYISSNSFNRKSERKAKILAASEDTFGFDCVCFIKGLLWGWNGNENHVYGGAEYKANGIPDIGADQLIQLCTDVSEDFSTILPGECVWLPGHCGIYVGDGLAVEATYEPEDGVQLQCVLPMGTKSGYPATGWVKHGKLPWVSYEADTKHYRVTLEKVAGEDMKTLEDMAKAKKWQLLSEEIAPEKPSGPVTWEPALGDVVQFKGGLQFSSANASAGTERPAGLAKITKIVPGKLHPYHLVKTGKTGPYGWVDRETFEKA